MKNEIILGPKQIIGHASAETNPLIPEIILAGMSKRFKATVYGAEV